MNSPSPLHYYRWLAALSAFLLAAGVVCVLLGVWAGWYAVILGAAYAALCAWSVRTWRRQAYDLRTWERGAQRLAAGVRGSNVVRLYDPPSLEEMLDGFDAMMEEERAWLRGAS